MENDYLKAIVSVVLPAQILDYFIVVGVEQTKTEIHISLDECNNKDFSEDIHFESKGFMEPVNGLSGRLVGAKHKRMTV